ncbi:MAG: DUF2892 domain-containing protein [Candidatus Sericytochromatia bacterium]
MTKNVGMIDKSIRLVLGLALISYGVYSGHWIGFVAAVPILTALINWCPLYSLVGINTCPAEHKKA